MAEIETKTNKRVCSCKDRCKYPCHGEEDLEKGIKLENLKDLCPSCVHCIQIELDSNHVSNGDEVQAYLTEHYDSRRFVSEEEEDLFFSEESVISSDEFNKQQVKVFDELKTKAKAAFDKYDQKKHEMDNDDRIGIPPIFELCCNMVEELRELLEIKGDQN